MTRQDMIGMIKNRLTESLGDKTNVEETVEMSFYQWFHDLVNQGIVKEQAPQPKEQGGGGGEAPAEGGGEQQ